MEPRYRLVIFDFDGTLADSFPWLLGIFNQVADRFGFRRVEDREIETLRGYGGREMLSQLGIPTWKLPLIARHMRRLMASEHHAVPLFPGVDALLRGLADAGIAVAVVTSNADENVRAILGPENVGRVQYFECGASMFGKRSSFRRVLRRSGVPPAEALCVGDELRDLEAARAARIPFGAVSWGYATPAALESGRPVALFAGVEDILELVTGESIPTPGRRP